MTNNPFEKIGGLKAHGNNNHKQWQTIADMYTSEKMVLNNHEISLVTQRTDYSDFLSLNKAFIYNDNPEGHFNIV